MCLTLKLSMRQSLVKEEQLNFSMLSKELAWWEAGNLIIYPDQKIGLIWAVSKTLIIFMSLFSFTYSAAFFFEQEEEFRSSELFFDYIQLIDIILACFTAKNKKDISDSTKALFKRKENELEKLRNKTQTDN